MKGREALLFCAARRIDGGKMQESGAAVKGSSAGSLAKGTK